MGENDCALEGGQSWLENFRLSRRTFDFVCQNISANLLRQDTRFRKAVSVEKRVAICLWHLATGEDFRSLAWRFGVGKRTACEIVNVCKAIVDLLLPTVIVYGQLVKHYSHCP